ncbi:MAG: aminotransferase class III-fold pyridoxal phosphate-dependent enzyme [Candidatus Rokubacteria bacterium]|nr:aminotransferase class III-fold pyridoxal phosphate-dependent enzyme [Candidatus Rokubacteria bacterium]
MAVRSETRTAEREAELTALAERVFPGGVLGTFQISGGRQVVPDRGRGARVWDVAGHEYLDYVCGGGPMILGHCHPAVTRAVTEQLAKGTQFYGSFNEPSVRLATELVGAIPCADQIRFCTSGAEGTFYALRLARAYTGRDKVLKFEGGYHGHHDYSMMSSAAKVHPEFPTAYPDSAGIPAALLDQVLVAPFNDLGKATEIIERHRNELAAVIVEPVQRFIAPVPGFLSGLRDVTRATGVCLIFDEVVTGFRLAYGGAQAYYGAVPELAVYGKIIGGGLPLAAVAGTGQIMQLCDPRRRGTKDPYVYQSGTLNGSPLAAVAGLATLAELRAPGAYEHLTRIGERIRTGLQRLCQGVGVAAQVLGVGPLWHVLFTDRPVVDYRSAAAADMSRLDRFQQELLAQHILCIPRQRSYMSLAHADADVDETLEAAEKALTRIAS